MTPPPVVSSSRRKRQRKIVSHYSDDNPSTFTVKVKKGDKNNKETSSRFIEDSADGATAKRRKVGRPRKHARRTQAAVSRKDAPQANKKKKSVKSPTPPESQQQAQQQQQHDTVLSHAWTVVPVVPPQLLLLDPLYNQQQQPENHPVHGKGLGKSRTLPRPSWDLLNHSNPTILPPPPSPLREDPITCMTSTVTNSNASFFCVGHASGSVNVYTTTPRLQCLQTVCTSALSRQLETMRRHNGTLSSTATTSAALNKRMMHFLHSIHRMDMTETILVVSTAQEVECWDLMNSSGDAAAASSIQSRRALWRFELPNPSAVILNVRAGCTSNIQNRGQCLVVWGAQNTTKNEEVVLLSLLRASSPARTPQPELNSTVTEPVVQSISLPGATKCGAATFDQSDVMRGDRLLVLVECSTGTNNGIAQPGGTQQELQLLSRDHALHYIVSCRAVIPTKAKSSLVGSGLSQTEKGSYTLLACTNKGGVRIYQTKTLLLLQVYGESLVLHGKTVQWQEGFMWFPEYTNTNEQLQVWRDDASVERGDELQYRQAISAAGGCKEKELCSSVPSPPPGTVVVGVPQAGKEPKELQETLHLWHWLDNGKVAAHTIPGPPKSGGVLPGLMYANGSLFCVSYERGELWQLKPIMKSDFPGIMYPPGYHVVDDNVEYLEDEDEVDILIDGHLEGHDEHETEVGFMAEVRADDLEEAMRRSLIEQSAAAVEEDEDPEGEDVVVTVDDDTDDLALTILPCHPEPGLRLNLENNNADATASQAALVKGSPQKEDPSYSFVRGVLKCFPQLGGVNEARRQLDGRPSLDELVEMPPAPKPVRGRQTKRVGLEATIKASILPELRRLMFSKEAWTYGEGFALQDVDRQADFAAETKRRGAAVVCPKEASKTSEVQSLAGFSESHEDTTVVEIAKLTVKEVESHASREDPAHHTASAGDDTANVESSDVSEEVTQKIASARVSDAAAEALAGMFALHRASSEDAASPRKRSATAGSSPPGPYGSAPETETGPTSDDPTDSSVIIDPESMGSSQAMSSDPGYAVSVEVDVNSAAPGVSASETKDAVYVHCDACRGRMVVHSCGKREIPIDYEAIERAEEEKRRKQEEEKKRLQAEKRRQADIRRREAKRLKREEAERQRQQELNRERVRVQEMEEARQAVEEQRHQAELVKERRRAELWQRLLQSPQQVETANASSSPSVPRGWQTLGQSSSGQPNAVSADSSSTYTGNSSGLDVELEQNSSQNQARSSTSRNVWDQQWAPERIPPSASNRQVTSPASTTLYTSPSVRTASHGFTSPNNDNVTQRQESSLHQTTPPMTNQSTADPGLSLSYSDRQRLTLERCTSAQLGTVEALAALANGFVQSPKPTSNVSVPESATPNEAASSRPASLPQGTLGAPGQQHGPSATNQAPPNANGNQVNKAVDRASHFGVVKAKGN